MQHTKSSHALINQLQDRYPTWFKQGIENVSDVSIEHVTDDTRDIHKGSLYLDRPGPSKRVDHEALRVKRLIESSRQGAEFLVTDLPRSELDVPENTQLLHVSQPLDQTMCGQIASCFYDDPADHLKLLGVTGTNGKTTIALLMQYFCQAIGIKAGLLGTILNDDGRTRDVSQLTTPGAVRLTQYLAQMVQHGCQAVCMEVSSHALSQGRVGAFRFDGAIFTNLTGDHLDYHKTMEAYVASKAILFEQLTEGGVAVINTDDAWCRHMMDAANRRGRVIRTSMRDTTETDYLYATERLMKHGLALKLQLPDDASLELHAPLVGQFNACNLVQAYVLVRELFTPPASKVEIENIFRQCPQIPGRMERVYIDDYSDAPEIIVDYAHTHDALENVLRTLRMLMDQDTPDKHTEMSDKKIWVVVGAGGDRDASKRPKMARISQQIADHVILTSDNPRTESPVAILNEMMSGILPDGRASVEMIVDREQAIEQAVMRANKGDIVLLAGKGHEDYQVIGESQIHFDDREMARKFLALRTE